MDWAVDYEEDSLPVLDQDGRLLGVITAQEVVDYLEHASKDVVGRLAGISDGEDGDEDLRETLAVSLKKRMPWLVVLLFLGMFVSSIVGMFEGDRGQGRHPGLLPVPDSGYGGKCGNPVPGRHHPGAHG